MTSVSSQELQKRRQELRHQRRLEFWQAIGRSTVFSSIAGGLFWSISLSHWTIHQASQIQIIGDLALSEDAIRALLPLSYPQSLLQLSPQELIEKLKSNAHISQVKVTRQLLPPSLIVEIQETQPVATAIASKTEEAGLLDEKGIWMPVSSYRTNNQNFPMPNLKVTGLKEQYLPHWAQFYRDISQSPVKILEIDWQDPTNLILKTELGKVHFGPYTHRFSQQLALLSRMQELPKHVSLDKILYIDLINLKSPTIKVTEEKKSDPQKQ